MKYIWKVNLIMLGVLLMLAWLVPGPCHAQSPIELRAATALKSRLADPFSAVIRVESRGPEQVCGFFNAKNAFGAYVGFQPFLYLEMKGSKPFVITMADEDLAPAIARSCKP